MKRLNWIKKIGLGILLVLSTSLVYAQTNIGAGVVANYDTGSKTITVSGSGQIDKALWDQLKTGKDMAEVSIVFTSQVSLPADCSNFFENVKSIKGLENVDTSTVTRMAWMFKESNAQVDLSGFKTGNVTSFKGMFFGAGDGKKNVVISPDVSNWDMSNAVDITSMFEWVEASKLDLSKWNAPRIQEHDDWFNNVFGGMPNLEELEILFLDKNKQNVRANNIFQTKKMGVRQS